MYYIDQDYKKSLEGDPAIIRFKEKFQVNSAEIECYKIFRETGYLPRYCPK
jgi:hypothetical protein